MSHDDLFAAIAESMQKEKNNHWTVLVSNEGIDHEKQSSLHTLLDDNKCIILKNGNRYDLRPTHKVALLQPNMDKYPPAFVSRLRTVIVK